MPKLTAPKHPIHGRSLCLHTTWVQAWETAHPPVRSVLRSRVSSDVRLVGVMLPLPQARPPHPRPPGTWCPTLSRAGSPHASPCPSAGQGVSSPRKALWGPEKNIPGITQAWGGQEGVSRHHHQHSGDPEGGRKRPGPQNRLSLSGASPPVGEKNVTHQRLLTKPDLSGMTVRDVRPEETPPKVTHPLRIELELQRWGTGPREGCQGIEALALGVH